MGSSCREAEGGTEKTRICRDRSDRNFPRVQRSSELNSRGGGKGHVAVYRLGRWTAEVVDVSPEGETTSSLEEDRRVEAADKKTA